MRKALLFANGEWMAGKAVHKALTEYAAADVIAVDGGVKHAKALDLSIRALVGDLDSTPLAWVQALEAAGTEIVRFEAEKDKTDLELSLAWARKQDYEDLMILAAMGGRIDQQISNIQILAAPECRVCKMGIASGDEVLQVHHPGSHRFVGRIADRISLLPLTPEVLGVRTSGLRYPLKDETLYLSQGRGISNELCDSVADVKFTGGILMSVQQITSV